MKNISLHDRSLKARHERLLSGDLQIEDVEKLYSGKRFASFGRASFRELADFIAHPDVRERGPVTNRIRDMRTTFKPLLDKSLKNEKPSMADLLARAESNFRMASDEQIARLSGGQKRHQVQRVLRSAIGKMKNGNIGAMTIDEQRLAISFGDCVIWNPALRAQEVFDDFKHVMIKNGLLKKPESNKLDSARSLVILHAISAMHGTAFELGDGITGELQAGFNNREGFLEVTASPELEGYPKEISIKVGLFWTDLLGRDHVDSALVDHPGPWTFAIEIKHARIVPMENVVPEVDLPDSTKVIHIN